MSQKYELPRILKTKGQGSLSRCVDVQCSLCSDSIKHPDIKLPSLRRAPPPKLTKIGTNVLMQRPVNGHVAVNHFDKFLGYSNGAITELEPVTSGAHNRT